MSSTVRILGLDPGSLIAGYGVVDFRPSDPLSGDLVDAGVLKMKAGRSLEDRLVELEAGLQEIIDEHRPRLFAVEELYSHYNHPKTAIVMGHARGVLLLVCRRNGLRFHEYAANRVKQSLTGYGHASKTAMQAAVQAVWNLPEPPSPPDVADALAVALCCARSGDASDAAGDVAATMPR